MLLQPSPSVHKRFAQWMVLLSVAVLGTVASIELLGRIAASTVLANRLPGQAELFSGVRDAAAAMLRHSPDAVMVFDPQLSWRPRPGVDNGIDHINAQGLRALRDYQLHPAPSVDRIAVFGDSFVYGTEVDTQHAWPTVLEQETPGLEVLNYGVPGYGPDQALLRFEAEAASLGPEIVILAITTPSLTRILTVSSVFQSDPDFLSKPRFVLAEPGKLALLPNPLATVEQAERYLNEPQTILELGRYDYWYDPLIYENPLYEASYAVRLGAQAWSKLNTRYLDGDRPLAGPPGAGVFNEESTGFKILALLLERFRSEAKHREMEPLILLLPDGYSVAASREGGQAILAPVLKYCEENGFVVLDGTAAFLHQPSSTPNKDWFFGSFHYTEAGNAVIAEWVGQALARTRLRRSYTSTLRGVW